MVQNFQSQIGPNTSYEAHRQLVRRVAVSAKVPRPSSASVHAQPRPIAAGTAAMPRMSAVET